MPSSMNRNVTTTNRNVSHAGIRKPRRTWWIVSRITSKSMKRMRVIHRYGKKGFGIAAVKMYLLTPMPAWINHLDTSSMRCHQSRIVLLTISESASKGIIPPVYVQFTGSEHDIIVEPSLLARFQDGAGIRDLCCIVTKDVGLIRKNSVSNILRSSFKKCNVFDGFTDGLSWYRHILIGWNSLLCLFVERSSWLCRSSCEDTPIYGRNSVTIDFAVI